MIMIDKLVKELDKNKEVKVANGYGEIKAIEDFEDPNEVKVVLDSKSNAIYFSREPIPSRKKWAKFLPMYKQVCIIPFQRQFLLDFKKNKSKELSTDSN